MAEASANDPVAIPPVSEKEEPQIPLLTNGEEVKMENTAKIMFPPPSSWYQSSMAAARNDMWAYSTVDGIVVVRPGVSKSAEVVAQEETEEANTSLESNEEDKVSMKPASLKIWPEFSFLEIPDGTKPTSLSFCKSPWIELPLADSPLVSTSEAGIVYIWNLSSNSLNVYNEEHKGNSSMVEWSPRNPFLIYTADILGNLSVWNIHKNTFRAMNFGKIVPTHIAVSPHEDDVVAIGTKSGQVLIVQSTELGKILYKMRHEEEVFHVSWKPEGEWGAIPANTSYKEPFLITSIASLKPASIRVWDCRGKDVAIIRPWEKEGKDRKLSKSFVPSSWAVDPNTGGLILLSCGSVGEIIGWSESATRSDVIHDLHMNFTIFSAVQCGDILWTTSYEPVIIGWNLRLGQLECIIPTFKGVSSILSNPFNRSRLAIGGIDGCIRILSFGSGYPEIQPIKVPTVTNRLKWKISALTWHPTRDNVVGFGTDDGVLGIYEYKTDNKFCMMFDRRIHGTVYTVDFGPPTHNEDFVPKVWNDPSKPANPNDGTKDTTSQPNKQNQNLMLYAVGGQSVFMIHPSKHSNALIKVSNIIQKSNSAFRKSSERLSDSASEIKWTPDLSYLAVGYNDGRIEIYSPPFLKIRCWIQCHARSIQFFSWKLHDFLPDYKSQSKWLASSSNDGTARLFNLAQLFTADFKENSEAEPVQIISSVATLNGHGGMRVICLAWSPHDEDIIVTVSYDRTAVVWNVKDGCQIARYTGHRHRLVTCSFHPEDKYKVITASDEIGFNFSIHVWDYRQHPCSVNNKKYKLVDLMQNKAEPIKAELTYFGKVQGPTLEAGQTPCAPKVMNRISFAQKPGERSKSRSKSKAKAIMPLTSNALINTKHSLTEELRFLVDKIPIPEKKDDKAMQEIAEAQETPRVVDPETGTEPPIDEDVMVDLGPKLPPTLHLGVLGGQDESCALIKTECDFHEASGNWEYAAHLGNWLGNPIATIENAMKHGQLTETMVAISASYSKKLYYDAVKALAQQFVDKDEYLKAVSYLLIIERVDEAVEILVKKKLYREAILLAKSRFGVVDLPMITDIQDKWIAQLVGDGNFELACKLNCSLGRYSEALSNIEKRNLPYAWKGALYVANKANELNKAEAIGVRYLEDRMCNGKYTECAEITTEYEVLQWMMPIVLVHEKLMELAGLNPSPDETDAWNKIISSFSNEVNVKWFAAGILKEDVLYKTKIRNLLQLAIPQNAKEAILIITKNITLMLLDKESLDLKALAESCEKLAQMWLVKDTNNLVLSQAVSWITAELSSNSG